MANPTISELVQNLSNILQAERDESMRIRAQVRKWRDEDCGELHKGQDIEEAVQEVYKKVLKLLEGE